MPTTDHPLVLDLGRVRDRTSTITVSGVFTPASGFTVVTPIQYKIYPGGIFTLVGAVSNPSDLAVGAQTKIGEVDVPDGYGAIVMSVGPSNGLNLVKVDGGGNVWVNNQTDTHEWDDIPIRVLGAFTSWPAD